ncbi:hypothetical protein [Aquimarina aquimarini]|uniref:hypothetical protein n=1 Tax=Aquimarina aquimarini TaxID=1191734 RepID=UPI000D55027D|nr:hypothetical protein [Aquimarina aquimarini]
MNKLEILNKKANRIVLSVADDPQSRYKLRYEFYQKYGNSLIKGSNGLGNSELAFIDWEIKRGVLNPVNATQPGSLWWRTVNSHFLYLGTLAQLIKESGETFEEVPTPVNFWLDYINTPNECSWYRAHNSSIISGYQLADSLAFTENIYEQYFINIVFYRLLYAQSIVQGVNFGVLGKIFANPRGSAVSLITDIEAFYPSHYPLSKKDITYVIHHVHNFVGVIENVLDTLFIVPHLDKLYTKAAKWNSAPIVKKFVKNNQPLYPITENELNSEHFNNKLTTKKTHI